MPEVLNKQCVFPVAAVTPADVQIENEITVSQDEYEMSRPAYRIDTSEVEAVERQRSIDQLEYDSCGIEQNELEMAGGETWYHYGITPEDEAVERQMWIDQL